MEITKRHHYIPEFFIKEFAGEDGKLAVFNKEIGKLDKLRKSPKQIFLNGIETHLTLMVKTQILLKKYTNLEKVNLLKRIKKLL